MSSPVVTNAQFQSGVAAITDSIVTCQNNSVDFLYVGDGIGEQAMHERHTDPAGQRLGSHTQATNIFSGNLDLQKRFSTDADPRPGYILKFRSLYYIIAGAIGLKKAKNKTVTFSVPVEQETNPIITSCLGTTGNGQTLVDTGSASAYTKVLTTVNSAGTLGYVLSAWTEEYPSAVVPTGLTLGAANGTFAAAAVAAGTYYLKITVTDTVTGKPDVKGVGFLILTIS